MIIPIKKTFLTLAIVLAGFAPAAAASSALAADVEVNQSLCGGANLNFSTGNVKDADGKDKIDPDTKKPIPVRSCTTDNPEKKLNNLIAQIINIFSVIVGIAAVIMIIYGGFRYITSGGDSGNITTAKNTIIYALVGLLIVAFAQFVVKFILSKITN